MKVMFILSPQAHQFCWHFFSVREREPKLKWFRHRQIYSKELSPCRYIICAHVWWIMAGQSVSYALLDLLTTSQPSCDKGLFFSYEVFFKHIAALPATPSKMSDEVAEAIYNRQVSTLDNIRYLIGINGHVVQLLLASAPLYI